MTKAEQEKLRHDDILPKLQQFIVEKILKDHDVELNAKTPLLEWGILNSLGTAELIAYVRAEFGIFVPPEQIFGANFKNLDAVTSLLVRLQDDPAAHV